MKPERKFCNLNEIKLAPAEAAQMEFSGYGSIFNNVDSYGDIIAPGAFKAYIDDVNAGVQDWPVMLLQHGAWQVTSQDLMPVGVWSEMSETDQGLSLKGVLADIQKAQDVYTLMKMQPRPAIKGLSIGYYARDFETGTKSDPYKRLLKTIDLVEVSIVTFPANKMAGITSIKSATDFTERDFERLMQDAGFSRSQARDIINHGFKSFQSKQDAALDEIKAIQSAINRTLNLFKS
jgi:HK97 family phage prohead protease